MYYSKITPCEQNQYPNDKQENICSQLIQSQFALSKALKNIQILQQNLSFMITLNDQLQQQNHRLRTAQQNSTKTVNKIINSHEQLVNQMKQQNQQTVQLLEQTKRQLLDISAQLQSAQDKIQQKQRIINEQKQAYMNLQVKFLNTSMSYLGDNSTLMENKYDFQHITALQKQNNQLHITIQRLETLMEKQKNKCIKLEKDCAEFKQWMGSVLGINKVLQSSMPILMKEIAQRVVNI